MQCCFVKKQAPSWGWKKKNIFILSTKKTQEFPITLWSSICKGISGYWSYKTMHIFAYSHLGFDRGFYECLIIQYCQEEIKLGQWLQKSFWNGVLSMFQNTNERNHSHIAMSIPLQEVTAFTRESGWRGSIKVVCGSCLSIFDREKENDDWGRWTEMNRAGNQQTGHLFSLFFRSLLG